MTKPERPLPTDAEYRVLDALWTHGAQTVRELHERLRGGWTVRYTTVLKILQNLRDKGLVSRDDSARSHVYDAAVDREWATRGFVSDLADRVFDGSAAHLVMRPLEPAGLEGGARADPRAARPPGGGVVSALLEVARSAALDLHMLGWGLVYSQGVGGVVGLALWAILRALGERTAWARYALCCGSIVLLVGVPLHAWWSVWGAYGGHEELVADVAAELMVAGSPDPAGPLPGGWTPAVLSRAIEARHDHAVHAWIGGRSARSAREPLGPPRLDRGDEA